MQKKVWVVVTNDLQTDQRVNKVCISLKNAGYEPTLIGVLRPNSILLNPRIYSFVRMKILFQTTFLFYAEFNLRLFFKILFSKFDIVLANDTDTLLGSFFSAKIRRKPIVFDAHELFTEVPELINRPFVRGIWQKIENLILPHIRHAYTVCQPIADIYKQKNGVSMEVVRNAPHKQNNSNVKNKKYSFDGKKMILYQGAINIGRGIEWIIEAMPFLDNVVFCIAGDGDLKEDINRLVEQKNLSSRVFLLGKIPLEELNAYTFSADLGVCLLQNRGLNYYYSLPNRIFDFAQAGVPILATDFPEIRAVVSKYKIGELIDTYDPQFLADKIQKMLAEWNDCSQKQAIFAKAQVDLCWEVEEHKLLKVFSMI